MLKQENFEYIIYIDFSFIEIVLCPLTTLYLKARVENFETISTFSKLVT